MIVIIEEKMSLIKTTWGEKIIYKVKEINYDFINNGLKFFFSFIIKYFLNEKMEYVN